MSIDRCVRCNNAVDTDADDECYWETDACVCEPCRLKDRQENGPDSPFGVTPTEIENAKRGIY